MRTFKHRQKKTWVGKKAAVTALLLASTSARADFYLHSWENLRETNEHIRLGLDLGYYTSHSNFNSTNQSEAPSGLTRYSRIQGDVFAIGGFSERISLYGRASWARIAVDHSSRGGASFGFTDQTVGVNYRVWASKDAVTGEGATADIQIQSDFPAYNNNTSWTQKVPYLGDGSIDWTAGGFFTLPIMQRPKARLSATAGAGYTYRSAGFSGAIPWSAGIRYNYGGFSFGPLRGEATLAGVYSLSTDQNSKTISTSPTTGSEPGAGTGGSLMSNAVNPSLISFKAEVGYQLNPDLEFSVAYNQALAGQNSPRGSYFIAGVQTRIGTAPKGAYDPKEQSAMEYGRSNQGFVQYYNLEARVLKSHDRMNLVKIDKGAQDGININDVIDFFQPRSDGTVGTAAARGQVTDLRAHEAVIKVTEFFKEIWIDEGFLARRPIQ